MPTSDSESIVESGPPTEELHIDRHCSSASRVDADPDDSASDLEALFAEEQEDWPTQGPAKGIRMPWLAALLLVLLVASVGIWGGAYMQRHSSSLYLISFFGLSVRSPWWFPYRRSPKWVERCVGEYHLGYCHRHHWQHAVRDQCQWQSRCRHRRIERYGQPEREVFAIRNQTWRHGDSSRIKVLHRLGLGRLGVGDAIRRLYDGRLWRVWRA